MPKKKSVPKNPYVSEKERKEFLDFVGGDTDFSEEASFEEMFNESAESRKALKEPLKETEDCDLFHQALDAMTFGQVGGKLHPDDEPPRRQARSRKKKSQIDAILDLHGMRVAQAIEQVQQFCIASKKKGYTRVLIIHGKGSGRLKSEVSGYLLRSSLVTTVNPAPGHLGGQGAIIAYLR